MFHCLLFLLSVSYQPLGSSGLELNLDLEVSPENGFGLPQGLYMNPPGAPNLPGLAYYIGVPQTGGIKVEVIEEETRSYPADVPPKGYFSYERTSLAPDPVIYGQDRYYPELYTVTEPSVWRDLRVISLKVNPVRYNPIGHKVLVSSRLKLRILFDQPVQTVRRTTNFDNIYEHLVLNYREAKDWCILNTPLRIKPLFDMPFWFKMAIDTQGLYQIDYDQLKKFMSDPGRLDPRTLRVYTAGFDTLGGNVIDSLLLDSLVEVPILVYGEEDGVFNRGDYVLFYAFPASHINVSRRDTIGHINNPFDRSNFYWLTYGGKPGQRFARIDGRPAGGARLERLRAPVHVEEEHENPGRSGLRWAWQVMSVAGSGSWSFPISHPGADGIGEIEIGILAFGKSFKLKLFYNDSLYCDTAGFWGNVRLKRPVAFYGDSGIIRIDLERFGNDTFSTYLDYFELNYPTRPELKSPRNSLVVEPGEYRYALGKVTGPPVVLDVTDPRRPRLIHNLEVQGESLRFTHRVDSISLLYLVDLDQAHRPRLEPVRVGHLRQETNGCDYLILTNDLFYDQMRPLLEWRRRQFSCRMVKLSEIYHDFGLGKEEPAAIKYFLYYVSRNWQPVPKYVLFVGDGSYDYKNNIGLPAANRFFPPSQRGDNIFEPQENDCSDDWFVTFQALPQMVVGRLNVRSKHSARESVKKILDYERKANLGLWTKRIILVGDDEWSPYGFEWRGLWRHSADCETLMTFIPDSLVDYAKIYLNVYPNESGKKPKSRLDFLAAMNQGALCGAFYGHGNNHQLAHEGVFYGEDVNLVNNGPRNFFFYYGTCSGGRFDDSKYESICEEFVNRASGAIGTYGATRGTFPEENVPLGNFMFDNIFNRSMTIGECCYNAKLSSGASAAYCLFGDPGVTLNRPVGGVSMATSPETLRPLSRGLLKCSEPKYFISASVRDSLNGMVHYLVRDRDSIVDTFDFHVEGQPFFRGVTSQESIYFLAPRYATRHLPVLRFSIYNEGRSMRLDSVPLRGLAVPSGDIEPPKLEFYAGGKKLVDGDWVEKNLVLTGVILDLSGLNLLDPPENEQQGFGMYVNQNKNELFDLRNYFNYEMDSYQRGRFTVNLSLPDAIDTITVYVSDNNYNRAEQRLGLRVAAEERLVVEDFLVYPNPIRRDGYFTFNLSVGAVVDLAIYTVAGRLVRRIENVPAGAGFNKVYWDGLDSGGSEPANGVYLVKLMANRRRTDSQEKVSRVERLIIAHPKK